MALRKHVKWVILAVLGLICLFTILFFTYSISKLTATASHTLEISFAFFLYASYGIGSLWPLILLFGTAAYILYGHNKTRSGMLLASGLGLVSISGTVGSWLLSYDIWRSADFSERVTAKMDIYQLINVLPAIICFTVVYLMVWLVFRPLFRKWSRKKHHQLDTVEKKRSYRRYLQVQGGIFIVLALCFLPLSLYILQNAKSVPGIVQPNQTWNISTWVHSISGVLAGVELVVGLGLFLDRSRRKVPVGALLLGSSFVNLFILGFCYVLIAGFVYHWGIGNYRAYTGSMLFIIMHRVVSAVAIAVALLWCKKKNKTAAINSNKKAKSENTQHPTGT